MELNNVIKIENKWSEIFVYRYINGKKIVEHYEFDNYFYIKKSQLALVKSLFKLDNLEYEIIDDSKKSIYGDELLKVIPIKYHYYRCGKKLKGNVEMYEYSLEPTLKFMLENKISFLNKDKIRKAIIDIENDMSLDVENAPESITSLCLYDYKDNKYYLWAWHETKTSTTFKADDIRLFNNEREMLLNFINTFRDLNIDLLVGWNLENFDVPYILNRLKRLGFNLNDLTNFNGMQEVNIYKFFYQQKNKMAFDCQIPGMELCDMIPVMQKANCYKAQPASFSLKSTAKFYLKDTFKMDFDLNNWREEFDDFLKYNHQDVFVTKEIIDKYELFNFMDILHLEISKGLSRRLITYNSLVLLYALKHDYPNIIFPDKGGNIKVENKLLTKKDELKIKAAIVLTPIPGIHDNVILFDFKSLYPTIMRTFNLSPDTISNSKGIKIDDITMELNNKEYKIIKYFKQDKIGIYPILLKELMERRAKFKSLAKEAANTYGIDSFEYMRYAFRDDVAKQNLNSLYGVGAARNFELFNPYVAAATTSMSRKLITFVSDYVKEKGYVPVFGDSVTGNTTLLIKYKSKQYLYSFEEMLKNFSHKKTNRKDKDEFIFDDNLLVSSYNFKNKKIEFKKIKRFIMHKVNKKIYNITSKKYCFNVTEDHSFYDVNDNLISANSYPNSISFNKLKEKPKVVNTSNKFTNTKKEIDLLELSKDYISKYTNTGKRNDIIFSKDEDYFYLKYVGNIKKTVKFPRKIKIDSKLGFVLGAYIAEGSVVKKDKGFHGLRFATTDLKYNKKFYNYMIEIFGKELIYLSPDKTRISSGGIIMSTLFEYLGGHGCKGKKMPNWILQTNEDFFTSILDGYMLGDGSKDLRVLNKEEYLNCAGIGSKSKQLISQFYYIMKNVYNFDDINLRLQYRPKKDFYAIEWSTQRNRPTIDDRMLHKKNLLDTDGIVYDIEVENNNNFIDVCGGVVLHNTDSCGIKIPKDVDIKELGKELNLAIKNYILKNWPEVEKNYCIEFEYEQTFKKFMIKGAKKRYFAIKENDDIYVKGFQIIRHDYGKKVQEILINIFKDLLNIKNSFDMKKKLHTYYKEKFYNLSPKDMGIELKISKNLEEYNTKVQHIEAAKYSNKYLKTHFKAGNSGKLIYIKKTNYPSKYPFTEYILLDDDIEMPKYLEIDKKRMWNKLIIDTLKTLEELEELNIPLIVNENRTLQECLN